MSSSVSVDALWHKPETPAVFIIQGILLLFFLVILINIKRIIKYPRYPEDVAKIAIQVLFVVAFLTIFYFTHVIDVEHHVFVKQLKYIVSTVYNESIDLVLHWIQPFFEGVLPAQMSTTEQHPSVQVTSQQVSHYLYQQSFAFAKHMIDDSIQQHLRNNPIPPTDDSSIEENNNEVKVRAMGLVISVMTVVVCIVVMFKFLGYNLNLAHSLPECCVLLFSVMCTEYIFLTLVTEQFLASDPNLVRFYFFASIQDEALHRAKNQQT